MHFNLVKEALKEARFLQSVEKDENCRSGKIFSVEAKPLEEGLKVEIKQTVEACLMQMQAQQPKKEQRRTTENVSEETLVLVLQRNGAYYERVSGYSAGQDCSL